MGNDCFDLDECASADMNNCKVGAPCTNFDGGYSCDCAAGYFALDFGCVDYNECSMGDDNCASGTTCSNTDGSYDCLCSDGSKADSNGNCGQQGCGPGYFEVGGACFDLDECSTFDQHHCKPGATCTNFDGGYSCICPNGDEANSNGECVGPGYENSLKAHK